MTRLTRRQAYGQAVKKVRSERRFRIVRDCSVAGMSKEDAAAAAGLSVGGLDTLIYKTLGSRCWPLALAPSSPDALLSGREGKL